MMFSYLDQSPVLNSKKPLLRNSRRFFCMIISTEKKINGLNTLLVAFENHFRNKKMPDGSTLIYHKIRKKLFEVINSENEQKTRLYNGLGRFIK